MRVQKTNMETLMLSHFVHQENGIRLKFKTEKENCIRAPQTLEKEREREKKRGLIKCFRMPDQLVNAHIKHED